MLIDWFTVVAQAANFLILVWLLKRFLYKPILNALDAREQRIATELADADAKKAEAKMEREEYQRKNEEFDQQRAELLNKATGEATAERQRLLVGARKDTDALRAKLQDTLRSERQGLHDEIARRTRAEVFAIARKALTDLAGASLEERMVDVFTRRLHELGSDEKARLASMLKPSSNPVLVRSAFDLAPAQRALIEGAVKETLAAEIQVRFEVVPDLVSGIELTMQGQKIAWSIADYLASLEKGVDELLKENEKAEAQARATKPSELTQRIGKRAYELYEEHGHKEGLAAQDWETAEREIRKEILGPVKTEPKTEVKAKPTPDVKPQAKMEPELKPKPENKVALKPVAKDVPESAVKAEPKLEVKPEANAEPGPEAVVKPEKKVEPEPEESKPETKSP